MIERRSLAVASAAILAARPAAAAVSLPGALREGLDAPIAEGRVAGLVALLGERDRVRLHVAGKADLASGRAMQRDSLFRVASITKPVTAAAVMMLVEDGRLALDAPVDRWLPELANRRVVRNLTGPIEDTIPAARAITVRDLLTLRLGLGVIFADPATSPLLQKMNELGVAPGPRLFDADADSFLQRLGSLPLACQPGERWLYHTGLDVAGVLVARASGMGLGAFLQERLFAPLGMIDTGFQVPEAEAGRLATLYGAGPDGALEIRDAAWSTPVTAPPPMEAGGGGLISTADDVNAFGRMLLEGGQVDDRRLLKAGSVAEMLRDQVPPEVKAASPFFPGFWEGNGWGLGLSVATAPQFEGDHAGRFGWVGGTGTTFFCDPASGRVAVLMTQRMMQSPEDGALGLRFLKDAMQAP